MMTDEQYFWTQDWIDKHWSGFEIVIDQAWWGIKYLERTVLNGIRS
jgi:hypothetical protein